MRNDAGFEVELGHLLNRYSMESGSNTPDFLLAEYMLTCLRTYEMICGKRDRWYGIAPIPGFPGHKLEDK